jgi:hypothetical protein
LTKSVDRIQITIMTDAGLIGLVVSLLNGSNHRAIERQTREIIAAMPKTPAPPAPAAGSGTGLRASELLAGATDGCG